MKIYTIMRSGLLALCLALLCASCSDSLGIDPHYREVLADSVKSDTSRQQNVQEINFSCGEVIAAAETFLLNWQTYRVKKDSVILDMTDSIPTLSLKNIQIDNLDSLNIFDYIGLGVSERISTVKFSVPAIAVTEGNMIRLDSSTTGIQRFSVTITPLQGNAPPVILDERKGLATCSILMHNKIEGYIVGRLYIDISAAGRQIQLFITTFILNYKQ